MRRKLARQSLVALAVLVVSLMVAGLGLAGRQAYAAEGADAPSITITFKAGDGGTVGPEENLVRPSLLTTAAKWSLLPPPPLTAMSLLIGRVTAKR
ncbi:hypothetical protein [Tractidigestivibacter scatoligenes]|jgi:hypothetical protein|uniref:hypothetical protein n=1 Tax=Tractidigestivibacter scatoligenes TaxID=1299998 RepID=UPI002F352C74